MNLDMTDMRFKVIVSEPYDLDPKNKVKHSQAQSDIPNYIQF